MGIYETIKKVISKEIRTNCELRCIIEAAGRTVASVLGILINPKGLNRGEDQELKRIKSDKYLAPAY